MAAEHRGSASLAVVPGSGLSNMPAEIQELGQKGGCSPFGGEETQMPPGVRGSDERRCEKGAMKVPIAVFTGSIPSIPRSASAFPTCTSGRGVILSIMLQGNDTFEGSLT